MRPDHQWRESNDLKLLQGLPRFRGSSRIRDVPCLALQEAALKWTSRWLVGGPIFYPGWAPSVSYTLLYWVVGSGASCPPIQAGVTSAGVLAKETKSPLMCLVTPRKNRGGVPVIGQWLTKARERAEIDSKGKQEVTWGLSELFCVMMVVTNTHLYTLVKSHGTSHHRLWLLLSTNFNINLETKERTNSLL